MAKDIWIPIAKIGRPKGLKGEFFADTFNADSELLEHIDTAAVGDPDTHFIENKLSIESAYFNGKRWVVKLEGIHTLEKAQRLTHKMIFAKRSDFLPLEEGQYYHFDLVGLKVRGEQDEVLGVVKHVFPSPTNDILEIESEGKLYTCALVKEFLIRVSLKEGVIYYKKEGIVDAL